MALEKSSDYQLLVAGQVYFDRKNRMFLGATPKFKNIMWISVTMAQITGLIFLIKYAFEVSWWAPFVIFIFHVPFWLIGDSIFEKIMNYDRMRASRVSFVGWPICAYLMFASLNSVK